MGVNFIAYTGDLYAKQAKSQFRLKAQLVSAHSDATRVRRTRL